MTMPLRHLATVIAGQAPASENVRDLEDGLPFIQGNAEFGHRHPKPRYECSTPSKTCVAGDILLSVRAPVGQLNVADRAYAIGRGLAAIRPYAHIDARFLRYALVANLEGLHAASTGTTFMAVTLGDLKEIRLPAPPLEVQSRIADFLDEQTEHFDRIVNLRRRLVELLTEKAEHAIRQYIAEGLVVGSDADARRIPLKRMLTKVKRPPMPEGQAITAFRDGQVTARSQRRTEGFTEAWTESATFQGINVGDVVIHGLDGFAGAIGTSESEGVCSPVYHVCVPEDGDDPYFIGRMLRILALSGYLSLYGGSARERAVDFRNWSSFARAQVPIVDKREQKKIGALLQEIQILEDAVTRYASLIGERKQALIIAAVTGQFDVTTTRSLA